MPLPSDEKLIQLSKDLLAQFETLFGKHPGFRPAHAKGLLLKGTFTPRPAAAELSRAPHFSRESTPVTARFSSSTGLPTIPDNHANADPRGLAIRFHLAERVHTDIIANAADGFPARTGEEFLDLLRAIGATDPTKPADPANPSPLAKHLATHPAAAAAFKSKKPTPTSFARESYFGVTAMAFINDNGFAQFIRYRLVPTQGVDYLKPEDLPSKPAEFLFDELKQRIEREAIEFKLQAQLAAPGDVVDDATNIWPQDRTIVDLGLIRLTGLVPNDAAEQQHLIFDPIPRVEGIEPSNDPLLELRAAVYLISGKRRRAAEKPA